MAVTFSFDRVGLLVLALVLVLVTFVSVTTAYNDNFPTNPTNTAPIFGHSADEIDIRVGGVTRTLQDAITANAIGGGGLASTVAGAGLTYAAGPPVVLNVVGATGGGLTVNADNVSLLSTCTSGQVLKKSGSSWICSSDNFGLSCTINSAVMGSATTTVSCGHGTIAISGGATCRSGSNLTESVLLAGGTGWRVTCTTSGGTAYALCCDPSGISIS